MRDVQETFGTVLGAHRAGTPRERVPSFPYTHLTLRPQCVKPGIGKC